MDKKYIYTQAQMEQVFDHLNHLCLTGVENAKRIGIAATILENPEEIIEPEEGSHGSKNSTSNNQRPDAHADV